MMQWWRYAAFFFVPYFFSDVERKGIFLRVQDVYRNFSLFRVLFRIVDAVARWVLSKSKSAIIQCLINQVSLSVVIFLFSFSGPELSCLLSYSVEHTYITWHHVNQWTAISNTSSSLHNKKILRHGNLSE